MSKPASSMPFVVRRAGADTCTWQSNRCGLWGNQDLRPPSNYLLSKGLKEGRGGGLLVWLGAWGSKSLNCVKASRERGAGWEVVLTVNPRTGLTAQDAIRVQR